MKRSLMYAVVCLGTACCAHASEQGRAVPLPQQLAAVREGADLHTARTVSVIVSSRRMDDPPLPVRAEKLRSQLQKSLSKTVFTAIEDTTAARLNMELIIEPRERWGAGPKQTSPYLFLLLRDHANARVLYCGYRRVGFRYERALDQLAEDFLKSTGNAKDAETEKPVGTAELRACATEAMRLPEVGL